MAAIPDSIKIKLEVDTTELDVALGKLERFIELQKKSMSLPIPVNTQHTSSRADYVSYQLNKNDN